MKKYKKYLIFFAVLVILSPLGIILPEYFNSGDAWGEWSVETVKEQTGRAPEGMKKDATLYAAPVPDYNLGKEEDTISKKSVGYILSGVIGIAIIILLTFGVNKLAKYKTDK
jgi:cobalt/nickel transport protein